jgi:1,4-dihydroxy-2-naphthoyl-CoA synthase
MSAPVAGAKFENVLYEKHDRIAYVTLNHPNVKLVFEDAREDAAVHGVLLTGWGERGFMAGADISESLFGICTSTADKNEGTSAFLERRAPKFQGA